MSDNGQAVLDAPAFLARLRTVTSARIALARTGVSLTTADQLAFQLAHARARDAVHAALDASALHAALVARGWPAFCVTSAAMTRAIYLARPDLGRRLAPESHATLRASSDVCDIAIVVADGLSALAIESQAVAMLDALLPRLTDLRIGPIVVATQARVALGDEIGHALGARLVCVLIGERPGLSSPDSLGIYLSAAPRPGRTDAERNCISNIHAAGMAFDEAAHRCAWLVRAALAGGATGVALKDWSSAPVLVPAPQIPP